MSESAPARVFLVVVDETPEHRIAVRYAARRAAHTGGRLALLYVIEPTELQHFMAIEELARAERREALVALINEEPTISILVLAAGTGTEGPGPLVTSLAGKAAARLRIPIAIVPGGLTVEQVDALS